MQVGLAYLAFPSELGNYKIADTRRRSGQPDKALRSAHWAASAGTVSGGRARVSGSDRGVHFHSPLANLSCDSPKPSMS